MQSKSVRGLILGYKLPKTLSKSFREPIGKLFTGQPHIAAEKAKNHINNQRPPLSISIGDFCTKTLLEVNFFPDIIIYDGKTHRSKQITLDLELYTEKRAVNPREWILKNTWSTLENTISFCITNNCRVRVHIDGEEDLLVIPAILSSPLGSVIVYGQPPLNINTGITEEGIVVVLVDSPLKELAQKLLNKFEFHEELMNGNHNY